MASARRPHEGAGVPGDRPVGAVEDRALTPQSINLIVKRRCAMAGLDPRDYSAHRFRAGYLTEAARRDCAAGDDAAVAAPFGAAGGERLQRG